jgi:hypothetical protein
MSIHTLDPQPIAEEVEALPPRQLLSLDEDREHYLDAVEAEHHDRLLEQLHRSENGFREGRFTTWEEVKRRNGLFTTIGSKPVECRRLKVGVAAEAAGGSPIQPSRRAFWGTHPEAPRLASPSHPRRYRPCDSSISMCSTLE